MYPATIILRTSNQLFLIRPLTRYIYSEILKSIPEIHYLPPRRSLLIQTATAIPMEACSRQPDEAYKPFIYG